MVQFDLRKKKKTFSLKKTIFQIAEKVWIFIKSNKTNQKVCFSIKRNFSKAHIFAFSA
jgi:hypothetical protein